MIGIFKPLEYDRRSFEKTVWRYYMLVGFFKGIFFFGVGVATISSNMVQERLIFGFFLAVALGIFTQHAWFYVPEMKMHNELVDNHGSEYENKLSAVLSERSIFRFVLSHRIAECVDEFRKPQQ